MDTSKETHEGSDFLTGLALAIFNPFGIVWWISIYATSTQGDATSLSAYLENLFIIVGVLIWIVIFSVIVSTIRKTCPMKFLIFISKISSLFLIGYGLYYGYMAIV